MPNNLLKLRKQKKLTQEDLASRVGISVTTLRNWEKDRAGQYMFDTVIKLCDVLECKVQDLKQ